LLNLALVKGISSSVSLTDLKSTINDVYDGGISNWVSSLAVFSVLLTTKGSGLNDVAGLLQFLLILISSLAIIWMLRHVLTGKKVRVRDSFYKGMYPLVPSLLVVALLAIELVPMLLGMSLYVNVVQSGIAATAWEVVVWTIILIGLTALSLFLVIPTIMSSYIATLPDMTPVLAIKSGWNLVRARRWSVLRKIVFLPLALLILIVLIMMPIIMFVTPIAQGAFFVLTMVGILVIHSYLYTLYRELLT
jgi:hypothetical protein